MDNDNIQKEILNEKRTKKVLSILPFIITNNETYGLSFIWTGKWFKFVEILQEKVRTRYKHFDDGWSYQYYWGKWQESWSTLKLIK